jgi:hypothetical protein
MSEALYSPGGGEAPQSATNLAPSTPSADQLSAMNELTRRMGEMDNTRYDERVKLGEAVHAEISRGGTGWDALNGNPAKLVAEAEARALADARGDAKPAGATPPADYTAIHGEVFAPDEAMAFGSVMSTTGLDVRVVQGLVADVAADKRVSDAIGRGDAGIERRLGEVREFFQRQPGGMDDLRLAVAFGEALVAKDAKLAPAWDAAMLSENALFSMAAEARRLGFTPPAR